MFFVFFGKIFFKLSNLEEKDCFSKNPGHCEGLKGSGPPPTNIVFQIFDILLLFIVKLIHFWSVEFYDYFKILINTNLKSNINFNPKPNHQPSKTWLNNNNRQLQQLTMYLKSIKYSLKYRSTPKSYQKNIKIFSLNIQNILELFFHIFKSLI